MYGQQQITLDACHFGQIAQTNHSSALFQAANWAAVFVKSALKHSDRPAKKHTVKLIGIELIGVELIGNAEDS